ncbi:potassium transporter Trk [Microbacterium sp. zg.Y1090]|uniref:potassium transporter Trk n=1 Tax=Microbacterium TaxID=33882 RepID=UPI00214B243A|nr:MULTISPECIES: potassium transporter Trk [unclassified Microbacterium]MCR2813112.1 potassium transporter Trk [Microbacterium sp. zg.Y1084]MCR2819425.1 potassium transporter Trk [Microbacterium sp. zg.Y1090]MDL5487030.1 potassium transporter Trk [Microbacterium sp. zg-Y1211]WIM28402.1 potassium transporter Trk [Microbacterium sp. zg-Y1090]
MTETARLRRTPKFAVFLGFGAALGLLAALILTFAFGDGGEVSTDTGVVYSPMQVFGFLALFGVPIGIALGGIVALVFDRVLSARARDVQIEHEHIRTQD